jgi:hypothetical protein
MTYDNTFYVHSKPILPGQNEQFMFTAVIPQGLVYSSAIGAILAKYHVLSLVSDMGCCSNYPANEFLLIFHTNSPQI